MTTKYIAWYWIKTQDFTARVDVDPDGTIYRAAPPLQEYVGGPVSRIFSHFSGDKNTHFFLVYEGKFRELVAA